MKVYNRIRKFRRFLELSQTELGKRCGCSQNTISSIESGTYNCSISLALRLSAVFQVPIHEFFSSRPFDSDEWIKDVYDRVYSGR